MLEYRCDKSKVIEFYLMVFTCKQHRTEIERKTRSHSAEDRKDTTEPNTLYGNRKFAEEQFFSVSVCPSFSYSFTLNMCSLFSVQCSKAQSNQIKWLDIWCMCACECTCSIWYMQNVWFCVQLSKPIIFDFIWWWWWWFKRFSNTHVKLQLSSNYFKLNYSTAHMEREREGEITTHTSCLMQSVCRVRFALHCAVVHTQQQLHNFRYVSTTTINVDLWQNHNLNFKFCWVYCCYMECILLQFYNSVCLYCC